MVIRYPGANLPGLGSPGGSPLHPSLTMNKNSKKPIIYQVLPRLFGNMKPPLKEYGNIEENGSGKLADFTPEALGAIRELDPDPTPRPDTPTPRPRPRKGVLWPSRSRRGHIFVNY